MTTQEFVNKLSRTEGKLLFGLAEESESMLIAKEEFKNGYYNGLNKGLEIAVKALAFARQNAENGGDGCWDIWDDAGNGNCHSKTDEELLSIYLTEINEKK